MKTKALISFAVTVKLICAFAFAYADCWFSHEAAHLLCMLYISVAVIMIVVTVVTVIGVVGTTGAATGGDHHPHTTVGVDDILGLGQDLTPRVSIVRALFLEYRSVWQLGCSFELHRITTCFCYIKKKVLNSIKQWYPLYLYTCSTLLLRKSKI